MQKFLSIYFKNLLLCVMCWKRKYCLFTFLFLIHKILMWRIDVHVFFQVISQLLWQNQGFECPVILHKYNPHSSSDLHSTLDTTPHISRPSQSCIDTAPPPISRPSQPSIDTIQHQQTFTVLVWFDSIFNTGSRNFIFPGRRKTRSSKKTFCLHHLK